MKKSKPRNAGTLTESAYWSSVRSGLRRHFRYWKPMMEAKMKARRKNESENTRLKWEFQCKQCSDWFPDKQVEIDHIVPVGSLKCADDLAGFLERLTPEDGFQVLCVSCHREKTNKEREKR